VLSIVNKLANMIARRQVMNRSTVHVAHTASVNWRGIRQRPPARLTIGEGSIFEGAIAADRPEASVSIGSRTFFGNSTIVTACNVEIGNDVLVSWGCTIVDHDSHSLSWKQRSHDVANHYAGIKDWSSVKIRSVSIRDKVWIGFNVIVLKGVTVGEGAVIAAGSVVTRDVAPYTLVAGNPAVSIRSLTKQLS